jgi:hypothetical protein
MNEKQRQALCKILNRISGWSPARLDQWLRYEVGDKDTDEILAWLDRAAHIEFNKESSEFVTRSDMNHYLEHRK